MFAQSSSSSRAPPQGYRNSAGNSSSAAYANGTSSGSRNAYTIPIESEEDDDNYFSLIWGGEKMRIPLPPPDAPLSALRAAIEERTGVKPEHQKLIVGGAIMQKDLPLKTYGLVKPSLRDDIYGKQEEDQSRMPSLGMRSLLSKWGLGNTPAAGKKNQEIKITMIASKDASAVVRDRDESAANRDASVQQQSSSSATPATSRQQASAGKKPPPSKNLDEPRTVAQIDSIVTNTLDKLQNDIENQLQDNPEGTEKEVHKQYLMVSEVLLQTLMKLDGFEIDSSWTEARKARKEAIRKVQGLLDQIDAAKEKR
ncbi:hypothetical protein P389DRAFT_168377 [Cystobasidium minutum MCA 4210]|uniref:uncharacterized protein n=1 Tax=Cystobasidium minutum MCA 4210 TaxID=1397322 RepID=UPI0034CE61BA|eukprot:jgi/Rhomi1/168377/fgenesh1_kg.2_\